MYTSRKVLNNCNFINFTTQSTFDACRWRKILIILNIFPQISESMFRPLWRLTAVLLLLQHVAGHLLTQQDPRVQARARARGLHGQAKARASHYHTTHVVKTGLKEVIKCINVHNTTKAQLFRDQIRPIWIQLKNYLKLL